MMEKSLNQDEQLVQKAHKARMQAYAPYSGFKVGAAVLTENGHIYVGCNIENAAFGATLCAERTAIAKAVSGGHPKIVALAIASDAEKPTMPCGTCRQVAQEFGGGQLRVICADVHKRYRVFLLSDLLPHPFADF